MRKAAVGVILAILVVASLGAGYLAGNSVRQTETVTSTSTSVAASTLTSVRTVTSTVTSTSTVILPFVTGAAATALDSNGSKGVDLILAMNATTLKVGQSLDVGVSLVNVLPSTSSVPTSNEWDFQGIPVALWPPCYFVMPAEAVVLKGNYTLQGLQTAANFTFGYGCMEGAHIDHVVFQPSSSDANITGAGIGNYVTNANGTAGPYRLFLNFTTKGYWDLLYNSQQVNEPIISQQDSARAPIAVPFVPGFYTVAVADEWGQAAVLHFAVGPDSTEVAAGVGRAVSYLIRNFNPGTGLIPETPNSSTYWLYSDNYLAALALQQYGKGNSTAAAYASEISRSLDADLLLGNVTDAENQYLVLNASVPCEFDASQNYTLRGPADAIIRATLNNGTGTLSESQYADIAFLSSICLYRQGNTSSAMASYETGRPMFDGVGINDSVFANPGPDWLQYQTFKLALYIYASVVLHQSFDPSAVSILLSMQDPGGGFYTGYDSSFSHEATSTNTETTSLAILALEAVSGG